MPQVRSAVGGLRLSGWDFVAGVVDGHRLGIPFLGKAARAEVDRVLDLVGHPSACSGVKALRNTSAA
jgi:zinc/manganese transport system ATP-binding protein